jgi:hypothetical protein
MTALQGTDARTSSAIPDSPLGRNTSADSSRPLVPHGGLPFTAHSLPSREEQVRATIECGTINLYGKIITFTLHFVLLILWVKQLFY